ncbi:hypothetical protein DL766_001428 [Monosporascus sp. MC13-8B]|uniref:Secreted protein n=1 Tax=Monosporascus cannonballus TaxID=155416 RepID=A0ABY0GZP5_9PEZI|nr:hypothetical protein DL762_008702 [Monosporascus cannonballus]RYP00429.1 hypothetical protein DL763_000781 [Monosporascus cannonballus]RYP37612.1 hypothetical protein DL766_001428 [Monosporascus sp. MC13-8B]
MAAAAAAAAAAAVNAAADAEREQDVSASSAPAPAAAFTTPAMPATPARPPRQRPARKACRSEPCFGYLRFAFAGRSDGGMNTLAVMAFAGITAPAGNTPTVRA